jgi:hypothetical protein
LFVLTKPIDPTKPSRIKFAYNSEVIGFNGSILASTDEQMAAEAEKIKKALDE